MYKLIQRMNMSKREDASLWYATSIAGGSEGIIPTGSPFLPAGLSDSRTGIRQPCGKE